MYDEASNSDTKSIQSYSPSSSVTMRSVPIYRSRSQYDLDSVERKRHHRTSLRSRAVINKIVLDIRKSLYQTDKIFKSSEEQNHTDEIPKQNPDQPQLIGEERQDDAIFKVYLKRIRKKSTPVSNSSSTIPTLADDPNEQHSLTDDNPSTERGTLLYSTIKVYQLKAGTLEKIVEHLTNDDGELDTTHMRILFSTYRTFTNTRILIDTLITRYRTVLPASLDMTEDVRQKTLKSLRKAMFCLLDVYKHDFHDPPRYSTLNHFIKHVHEKDLQKQGHLLLEELKKDEENISTDVNNNSKLNDYLYNQKGFDYITPWNILDMQSTMIAEQLTIVDADLLKRMLPYECLTVSADSCSRRLLANKSTHSLSTVGKTIEYFNAVVARVTATILKEQDEQIRANVIEKWIDVAYQCRELKNFSSLTAILNGLLSGCIFRLNTAWSYVTQEYISILEELKNVFGSSADKKEARIILDKQLDELRLVHPDCTESKEKCVDILAINSVLGKKSRHKMTREQQKPTMMGTVPYLGIYLSDLTYIDSAYENTITIETSTNSQKKLINFEKHRKEFEILAQIKLFQSAANAYATLHALPRFKAWFDSVRIYTDTESWDLSYAIEPKETADHSHCQEQFLRTYGTQPLKALIHRFPSELSLESLGTSNNNTNDHTGSTIVSGSSIHSSSSTSLDKMSTTSNNSLQRHQLPQQQSNVTKIPYVHHSRSSSASSALTSSNGSSSQGYGSAAASPTINTTNCTPTANENESVIAKVQLAGKDDLLYKKVRIRNNERTHSVLKIILDKFGLDPTTYDRYCIEQKLPDRKILILDHCNVFYALARSSDDEQVDLIVREKTRQEREQKSNCLSPPSGHNRTPSGLSNSSIHSR